MKPRELDDAKDRRQEKADFAQSFGTYLRSIREQKKISQENLSIKAGYYRTYVNKIELGQYSPSLHTVWRLAHALDMSLADFFKGF